MRRISAGCPLLERLSLSHRPQTCEDLEPAGLDECAPLASLAHLQELEIWRGPLSADAVAALALLPLRHLKVECAPGSAAGPWVAWPNLLSMPCSCSASLQDSAEQVVGGACPACQPGQRQ